MRKINLENDFGTTEEVRAKNPSLPSNKQLTINWIFRNIDLAYAKTGISSDKRRIYASIIKKGNSAIEDAEAKFLELNEVEYKFIIDAFNASVTLPNEAKWIDIVEQAILSAEVVPLDTTPATNGK